MVICNLATLFIKLPNELNLPHRTVRYHQKVIKDDFRFHHLGIAVHDLAKAIPIYHQLFGYELTSGPFDDPIQKVSVCFLTRGEGDMTLELVTAQGPDSPVQRTLNQGGGAYHVCYEVPKIDDALHHMKAQKCGVLSDPVPAVAFQGRLIAWLSTPTRQLIELLQAV
jgi:methylmalonyl-CoA/ethylmalonyl-CoA epimerase